MKQNVGGTDRVIRMILGLALLSLYFLSTGTLHWVGLVGVIPLLTGAVGSCPLYSMLGFSTCAMKQTT